MSDTFNIETSQAEPFGFWFDTNDRCTAAFFLSCVWPYRFVMAVDTRLVCPAEIHSRAAGVIDTLAEACERQRRRLHGTDYSTGYEPWEPMAFAPHLDLAAVRFDPRATDAQQIRRDGCSIIFVLARELERAQEAQPQ